MDVDAELRRLRPYWTQFFAGADVGAMARDAADRVAAACAAWELRDLVPLTGGVVAVVAADATRVLKVIPRGTGEDDALRAEGVALAHWGAAGLAPAVLGRRDDGLTLLLERALPGRPLQTADEPAPITAAEAAAARHPPAAAAPEPATASAPDAAAAHAPASPPAVARLDTIGAMVRRLHALPVPAGVPHLSAIVPTWRATMADDPAELEDLLTPRASDVLVHGDLHGGNLLRAEDGWKVIDPHAAVADRHADVWALLDLRSPSAEPAAVPALLDRYAAAAGLDRDRAARWVRLRATVEARDIAATTSPGLDDADWATWLRAVAAVV